MSLRFIASLFEDLFFAVIKPESVFHDRSHSPTPGTLTIIPVHEVRHDPAGSPGFHAPLSARTAPDDLQQYVWLQRQQSFTE
jgi:hypothetical protein